MVVDVVLVILGHGIISKRIPEVVEAGFGPFIKAA